MMPQDRKPFTNRLFALKKRRAGWPDLLVICLLAVGSISLAASTVTMIDRAQAGTREPDIDRTANSVTILAKSDKPMRRGGKHHGPAPEEAIAACENQAGAAACSFDDPHRNRTINGTCRQVPEGFSACVPNDAPPPRI